MTFSCLRFVALILFATTSVLSGAAAAAGAIFIKGGLVQLQDDRQTFETPAHRPVIVDLEESSGAIGIGWEKRFRYGLAVGTEYLFYRNKFTEIGSPTSGTAEVHVLQAVGKKYFFESNALRPYVGVGIGAGVSRNKGTSSVGQITDGALSIVLNAAVGLELRNQNMSLMIEVKHMGFDVSATDREYDPSATGILIGAGFNW